MDVFFNYSIDCETPPNTEYTGAERRPFFGGPASWPVAEASVRGFLARVADLGVGRGATLFVYPDVARHQKALYREVADAGVEIALHLNGLRYSRLRSDRAKWLGEMPYAEQKEARLIGRPNSIFRINEQGAAGFHGDRHDARGGGGLDGRDADGGKIGA